MAMSLRPQRKNANKHTEHGLRLLEKSIQSDGFIDAQTAAADGEIISGSARLELSAEKFADVEPIIVESDGSRPVVVVRTDIPTADDPRAKRLSVAANQIAKTDFNPDGEILTEWAGEDEAIRAMFADSEWQEITGEAKPTKDAEPQTDRAAELLEKWQVTPGSLWQIGEHRLICGDCTDAATVARVMDGETAELMVTDPPYGVDYGELVRSRENQKQGGWDDIQNDALSDDDLYDLLLKALDGQGAKVGFVFHPPGERRWLFWKAVKENGWKVSQEIVWVKNAMVFGRADYQWRHEPCLYLKRDGAKKQEDRTQTTVWEVDKPTDSEHPTQKPVELFEKPIRNHTAESEIVFEPFSGSGTTLVACENLRRRCRAIEISPAYVAVALERMAQAFPGIEIKRLS